MINFINKFIERVIVKLHYELFTIKRHRELSRIISPNDTVVSGPFAGIKYHKLKSFGSPLFSKILGSYEDEIHPIITEKMIGKPYKNIIDIGCAEGYYTVGFAKLFPQSTIYAYDTKKAAIEFCEKFAAYNKLTNIKYGNFFSIDDLKNYNFQNSKSMIFSDCEGFEFDLFNSETIKNLTNVDVLVEVHDHVKKDGENYLLELFKNTHNHTVVKSNLKAIKDYKLLNNIDKYKYTDNILFERNFEMTWIFFESKV